MVSTQSMLQLIAAINLEQDTDRALDYLVGAVLEFTGSRNAMIARMNDEQGFLEVRNGTGIEWASVVGSELQMEIDPSEGIVSYVAATGAPLVTGNVAKEPRYRKLFDSTQSEIAMPVRDSYDRIRAVINIESDRPNAYSEESKLICELVAHLVAIVLERAEGQKREEALVQIGNALDEALTQEDLIASVIRIAGEVLRFQAFSIFLHDRRTDTYVLKGSVGRLRDKVDQVRYKKGEGCTGWVCETGKPIVLDNPQGDPRWRGKYLEIEADKIASFLAVPVEFRGRVIGVLRVLRRKAENPYLDNRFTQSDQRVLSTIAEQLATALENLRNLDNMLHSERMVAWGELSAKSSHMIGNRVFALKGDVNELKHLLEADTPDIQDLLDLQKSLSTNVLRVEEILQDFRDFVTATHLSREKAEINPIVESTTREVFPRRSPVHLDMRLAEHLPPVNVDSNRLRRAISELIENSFNYMAEGTMCVATSLAEPDEIRRGKLSTQKSYVKIEIEDTGPGVSVEEKDQIFQPFFSKRVKGMGLGLSIVKGIVDAHGGAIYEAGEAGHGAKFVILLPAADRSMT